MCQGNDTGDDVAMTDPTAVIFAKSTFVPLAVGFLD
jgi:hypothetical protein